MDIAFCYESVLPSRGGCETYIAGLARRLVQDGHTVHLYACRWDAAALPATLQYHRVPPPRCPRFLRPWFFTAACRAALAEAHHQVTVGFDKIFGVDVLYPQGGLYVATAAHNLLKHPPGLVRIMARVLKHLDPAHYSFSALERRQLRGPDRPLLIAISDMVLRHVQHYYGLDAGTLRRVRIATDPARFEEQDRPRRRHAWREKWQVAPDRIVALFAGMNYRLKGLEPLLHAVRRLPADSPLTLMIAGNRHINDWQRLARRLGVEDRVRFVGYCSDMRNCYFAADFFVHPTFYDPCSHVVLEAMACGLPVVTTRHNGASELMHPPREGFVIDDPHDTEHLAWCLTQMLDPARRAACAQAARRTAAQWTFEHHYRDMLAVFGEAAARKEQAA
jgi:UDP-glucose:(heptosyl)LPS alpha-1,3-glucosyltransferase